MAGSMKLGGLLVVAGAVLGATPVAGQLGPEQHMTRIGVGGGVSVPLSDARQALKSGVNGQGFLLMNAGGIPLRFNLGYQRFAFKDAVAAGASGQSTMMSGVAGLSLDLVHVGPVTPYVMAGVGAFHLKDELTTGGVTNGVTDTRFGVDGGAGVRLWVGRLEAFAEGRVQNVWTDAGLIDAKTIRTVPVTFGVLF